MKDYSHVFNAHPKYIDEMYSKYSKDATSVDEGWRIFFDGFEFGDKNGIGSGQAIGSVNKVTNGSLDTFNKSEKEFGVLSIIHGFRSRGHLISTTNPIRQRRDRHPHLELNDYKLTEQDLNEKFAAGSEIGIPNATLSEILERCKTIYAGNIGFEYAHIENREKRVWLRDKIENRNLSGDYGLELETKKRILEKLNGAVVFEKFLHTKYVGQKRFSLEGGESTIAALDAIIRTASADRVEEVIIGMAHRGRLNVLANIIGKTYEHIFEEFEGNSIPDQSFGDGDVKYHLGYSSQIDAGGAKKTVLKLAPNPSHLEAVNPVVEGYARAKADVLYGSDYDKILPILIHGDAAIAGQGIVYETVQMSQLDGYYTGGSIHFVINNQVGFTTDFDDARSSTYCTAAAALVQAPVFHVNGDDPEAVVYACKVATEYRQKFNNDVFIDMVCYRRHGHNEGDDPKFTQPEMYKYINNHPNPREIYIQKLLKRGELEIQLAENLEKEFWNVLQDRLNFAKEQDLPYALQASEKAWQKLNLKFDVADFQHSPNTGIPKTHIDKILKHLSTIPDGLTPLSKVNRLLANTNKLLEDKTLDWGLAELLAYGSILLEKKNVRMSGQDVKRGTFSHRHMVFRDAKNYKEYNRLDGISKDQGKMMIYNSLLSEFAVLGFEYGYTIATSNSLVIWEAQFGDFANGAQTMMDQFISAAESKWQRSSGIVMLLPHGYEGQGPEHSSARLERYLQSTAEANMSVVNMTTPANLFHVLRRQLVRDTRKPLIIMSPKSMLRHPNAKSSIDDFTSNNKFQEVIDDPSSVAKKTKRLLFCTGKLYYDLLKAKEDNNREDVAIVRIEQLYPFPEIQVNDILKKYKNTDKFWVQEESQNMGAWDFLMRYWRKTDIELISRPRTASPATGHKKVHDRQQEELINKAMG